MAIDTLEKRASATNIFLATVLPVPDGVIDAADRLQVGGDYSGIPAAVPEYPTTTIRERIIEAMITRLENITVTKGYNTDCGGTVFRAQRLVDPDSLPLVCVWPQQEEIIGEYGKMTGIMPVRIECLFEFGAINPDEMTSKIVGDLSENILGIQWTLPFTDGTTEIVSGDIITGATSAATAYVSSVRLMEGAWDDSDAAGQLSLRRINGTFQSENIKVGGNIVAATTGNIFGTASIENSTGGLADTIECTEIGTVDYPEDDNQAVGVVGLFEVRYNTNYGDPYNNG